MVEMNDLIKIKNLFLVSNTENRNLIDISNLQFDNNSISVIMGPNGAGKTLLLNLIQGLISSYTGDIDPGIGDIIFIPYMERMNASLNYY